MPEMAARTSTASSGRLPLLVASAPRPESGSAAGTASSGAMSAVMPLLLLFFGRVQAAVGECVQQRLRGGQDCGHVIGGGFAVRGLEEEHRPRSEPETAGQAGGVAGGGFW